MGEGAIVKPYKIKKGAGGRSLYEGLGQTARKGLRIGYHSERKGPIGFTNQ